MNQTRRLAQLLLLVAFTLLATCTARESKKRLHRPAGMLHATRLEGLSLLSSPSLFLRWPQFLLVEGENRFLWGTGREILRIESSKMGAVFAEPTAEDVTRGLEKLAAGAMTPKGTLILLDVSGRIATRKSSGQRSRFTTYLENRPANLAATEDRIYLLLQGDSEESSAVVGYTFTGLEVGRWGTMPVDGIIQASLRGGGIAACPDGAIFFSYINSSRIFKLQDGANKSVQALDREHHSFQTLSASDIHRAYRESMGLKTVSPLVKLGLSASRVMTLRCSGEGLLLRQVARPAGGGAYVEVWDPPSGTLVGTLAAPDGILLDVSAQTLYFGRLQDDKSFILDRVQLRIERSGERRAK